MSETQQNLFGNLSSLGLDGLDGIPLYLKEEEQKGNVKQDAGKKTSTIDPMFDRKIQCPVCGKPSTVRAIRSSCIRVLSRDTDFMTCYGEPNPMLYDTWFCKYCGYAAPSSKFNTLLERQKMLIKEKISSKWKIHKEYPPQYTEDIAIEINQLALLNTVIKMGKDSEKAMICMKIAWLNRLKKDTDNEKRFLHNACEGFQLAYQHEVFPIAGMDEATLGYLIGELSRRLGDTQKALQWFGRVLVDRNAKQRIKDMARDQKDIMNSAEKAKETAG